MEHIASMALGVVIAVTLVVGIKSLFKSKKNIETEE